MWPAKEICNPINDSMMQLYFMDIFAIITKGYDRPYSINNTNQSDWTVLTR